MKKYEYNLVIVDYSDAVEVMRILNERGQNGERFIGWKDCDDSALDKYRYAIFEKEIVEEVPQDRGYYIN